MTYSAWEELQERMRKQHTDEGRTHKEVVRPEVLAYWRTFLPEETVEKIVKQREWVEEERRKEEHITVPDFGYRMPRMKPVEEHPKALALAIMSDGTITPKEKGYARVDAIGRIDRIMYRYEYEYWKPEIEFSVTDLDLAIEVANMMLIGISPERPRPPKEPSPMFRARIGTARAVRTAMLIEPHLVGRWKKDAQQILKLYRERPEIPV